jgi:DNA uptake protein ComE-like DNA-binding protein
LVDRHTAIARELGVGRPDLARGFDDGGLVDVNGVPVAVLATLPGITQVQAQAIVADRVQRGSFGAVDDLATRGLLPAPIVADLRDRLIVLA